MIEKEFQNKKTEDKILFLNKLSSELNKISPQQEPVNNVQWIDIDTVDANSYNPNSVASQELELLYESIKTDGYTMPIVLFDMEDGRYEIIDGYHRCLTLKNNKDIKDRTNGMIPAVVLKKSLDERMGSTIRHNRARGSHSIRSMSDIVLELIKMGWGDDKICEKLGMERDEVLRLKQISGLKEAFSNHEFSKSWDEFERKNYPDEVGITKTIAKKRSKTSSPPLNKCGSLK